jgi:hypothetical protein
MKKSELRNLIREEIRKVIKESSENTFEINPDLFRYDMEDLEDEAKDYLSKYDGGIVGYDGYDSVDTGKDYQWAIAMGDDFPHAIIVKSPALLQDKRAMDFIRGLESSEY